MLIWRTQCNLS